MMKEADCILLCKGVSFAYTSPLSVITCVLLSSVCVCTVQLPHLPGLTAPPAGISGDVHALTARLPGQKGELPHSTTDEAPQVDG